MGNIYIYIYPKKLQFTAYGQFVLVKFTFRTANKAVF